MTIIVSTLFTFSLAVVIYTFELWKLLWKLAIFKYLAQFWPKIILQDHRFTMLRPIVEGLGWLKETVENLLKSKSEEISVKFFTNARRVAVSWCSKSMISWASHSKLLLMLLSPAHGILEHQLTVSRLELILHLYEVFNVKKN